MRTPRQTMPGGLYHVVARINRQEFALRNPEIKEMLLLVIARSRKKYRYEIISICVMDNHIHLMLRMAQNESLSKTMQWILSVFAIRYNKRMGIRGHLWYDRFKSRLIKTVQHFKATYQYIIENPVRAGMCSQADDYPYGPHMLIRRGAAGGIDGFPL
ncbi:MAG: REP-associated tyrosine transposase [Spirochaetaceae bacterium]